jgi:hypothetical protein
MPRSVKAGNDAPRRSLSVFFLLNLKTARALQLNISPTPFVVADQLIE